MKQITKKFLQPGNTDMALVVVRVSIALLMLSHGIPKLAQFVSDEPIAFVSVFGMSPSLSLAFAVFAEVLCSVLILAGLGTRLAAIPLIVTMAVAAFYVHAADPFAVKEVAILYLAGYVLLAIAGSGKYSLDNLIIRKSRRLSRHKIPV
jgi:putative oxidoreductase